MALEVLVRMLAAVPTSAHKLRASEAWMKEVGAVA